MTVDEQLAQARAFTSRVVAASSSARLILGETRLRSRKPNSRLVQRLQAKKCSSCSHAGTPKSTAPFSIWELMSMIHSQ